MTAGNSHTASDGAAALILASPARADDLGVIPLPGLVSSAVYGKRPLMMGIRPSMGATAGAATRGLTPEQIDVWKIHEAFSAQASVTARVAQPTRRIPSSRRQTHPQRGCRGHRASVGRPGVRYALTLATELRERHLRYGAIGVCIGCRPSVAMILETQAA